VVTLWTLSLPTRAEVWRSLRGMRALPPAAVRQDTHRFETYQTALEQAQQLLLASEQVGYAARPLLLFYGLSQGGRAVAAASNRLAGEEWRLSNHGIGVARDQRSSVGRVAVIGRAQGSLPGVAAALGTETLPPGVRVSVADLWGALPESSSVPLSEPSTTPALSIEDSGGRPETGSGYLVGRIGNIPAIARKRIGSDRRRLGQLLDRYPSAQGWGFSSVLDGHPLDWQPWSDRTWMTTVHWPYPPEDSPEFEMSLAEAKASAYRASTDRWLFPAIASMQSPIHPILTWWAVLFALSSLARYEPDFWARLIRIDASPDANAIEHLLDEALDAIPSIILRALEDIAE
jgi:hypothetical protein